MTDDQKPKTNAVKFKPLTPATERLLDFSCIIFDEPASSKEAAYLPRELVQCTLPHRNPGDVPYWTRHNGGLSLTIRPGWDRKTKECLGYPYGSIPRLLLFWITTEVIRTKSRRLELGRSLSQFMLKLGLNPLTGRGKRGDATRLRNQMERLFNALISFDRDLDRGCDHGVARMNMAVVDNCEYWWHRSDTDENLLWGSWIEIGERFYNAIIAAPVPTDVRALRALKKSPLALDLYAFLTYESFRANKIGKPRFATWKSLHSRFGGEYTHMQNFRSKVKAALVKIQGVYPGLRLGQREGGIEVLPGSRPALPPRLVDDPVSKRKAQEKNG